MVSKGGPGPARRPLAPDAQSRGGLGKEGEEAMDRVGESLS